MRCNHDQLHGCSVSPSTLWITDNLCLCVSLSVSASLCLFLSLSVCLSVCLSLSLSLCLSLFALLSLVQFHREYCEGKPNVMKVDSIVCLLCGQLVSAFDDAGTTVFPVCAAASLYRVLC